MTDLPRAAAETSRPVRRSSFSGRIARKLLSPLESLERGQLTVVMPDGSARTYGETHGSPRATLTIRDPAVLWRVVRDGEIGFGEAYVDGGWECDDLVALLRLFHENAELLDSSASRGGGLGRLLNAVRHRLRRNSVRGSRENVQDHYDLGDDLYERFLDPTMSYSCGIYGSAEDDLETAQRNKMEAVLDLARLDRSTRMLEIGCGWGSVSVEAAKRFGCRVKGITLSENQLHAARRRAEREGVSQLVEFELVDYRDVRGTFDRIVSIEMIEAVGHAFLDAYFASVERLLAPEGIVVIQAITVPDQRYETYRKGSDWLRKHIFPGGNAPSLTALCEAMTASSSLVVESLRNIGDHYAPTLRAWRDSMEKNAEDLQRFGYDERFRRMWRYYLAYCEAGFAARTFGDVQLVLTRPNNRALRAAVWS